MTDKLIKQINKADATHKLVDLPCLGEIMEKNGKVAFAMYDATKRRNSTAIKMAVKHLDKIHNTVGSIGADVVIEEYVKTGDRSLIDPFYVQTLFTPAQWKTIATDVRRKNSFARQVLPLLFAVVKADKGFEYQMKQIDIKYQKWAQGTNPTSADANIYSILHDVFSDAIAHSPSEDWLESFGTDAPIELIKKYSGEKHTYYFSSGVKLFVGETVIQEFKKPVVMVRKIEDRELEPVYEYHYVRRSLDPTKAPSYDIVKVNTNEGKHHRTTHIKVYDMDNKEIYTNDIYMNDVILKDSREGTPFRWRLWAGS